MRKVILVCVAALVLGAYVETAQAVPALARKYKLACSECHSAVPYLNEFGRQFKEHGYAPEQSDLSGDIEIGQDSAIGKVFPLSLRVKSKVLEMPDDGVSGTPDINGLDPVHEAELLYAGRLSKKWSAFGEFEYEDEDGFNAPGFATGVISYHHSPAFNVTLGWAPPFWADPYDSLSDMRRLSLLEHLRFANWKSGQNNVADERLRKSVQQVNVNGRVGERVWYMAGVAASRTFDGGTNRVGSRPKNFMGRVVVDVIPQLSLGAFYLDGEEGNANDDTVSEFQRTGLTFEGHWNKLIYRGGFAQFDEQDKTTPGAPDVSNDLVYVTLTFVAMEKNGHPFLVPELTYNTYDDALVTYGDGGPAVVTNRSWDEIVAGINLYVRENVRLAAEYWKQIDTPNGDPEKSSLLLGADFVF